MSAFFQPEMRHCSNFNRALSASFANSASTDALSAERTVNTEDKTVRVHVEPQANWLATTVLVLLLLGVVGPRCAG